MTNENEENNYIKLRKIKHQICSMPPYFVREDEPEPESPLVRKVVFKDGQKVGVQFPTGSTSTIEIKLKKLPNDKPGEEYSEKAPYFLVPHNELKAKVFGKELLKMGFLESDLVYSE